MELRKRSSHNESIKNMCTEVSVTALMTRVTRSMSLTVDTPALVTRHPSVEAKRTALGYTQSMALGGEIYFSH